MPLIPPPRMIGDPEQDQNAFSFWFQQFYNAIVNEGTVALNSAAPNPLVLPGTTLADALKLLRVNATGTGYELRTVAEVQADLSIPLGIIPISLGGTGASTKSAAFDALSPLSALGDVLYGGAAGTGTRLAGNITATRNFLRQTGTGAISAAPAWDTVTKTDVGLANVENTALSTWAGSTNITTLGTIGSALVISKNQASPFIGLQITNTDVTGGANTVGFQLTKNAASASWVVDGNGDTYLVFGAGHGVVLSTSYGGTPYHGLFTDGQFRFGYINSAYSMYCTATPNIGIFTTSWGTNAAKVLGLGQATTPPSTSPADMVQVWSADWNGAGTNALFLRTEEGTVYRLGSNVGIGTTVATGASSGDIIIPNAGNYRAVNAAGNNTIPLIGLDSSNIVGLGGSGAAAGSGVAPSRIYHDTAAPGAGSTSLGGVILVDDTNHLFVYYTADGGRYQVVGVPF